MPRSARSKAAQRASRPAPPIIVEAVRAAPKPKAKARPEAATIRSGGAQLGGMLGKQLLGNFGLGALGNSLGKTLGGLAGGGISKILGFGQYYEENTVGDLLSHMARGKDPAVMRVPEGEQAPTFSRGPGGVRIAHREFMADLEVPAAPTPFNNTGYEINPGNEALFPWLSRIAINYQQYRIHGMVVLFEPLTSEVAAGGPMGSVMLGTNYNVLEPVWGTPQQFLNSEFAVSAKPSLGFMHVLECAPQATADPIRYVRNGQAPTDQSDDRLYDFGTLQIATEGLPGSAGQVLGRLVLAYDIEFFKPRVSADALTHWYLENGLYGNTVSTTAPWGLGPANSTVTPGHNYMGDGLIYDDNLNFRFGFTGDFTIIFNFAGTGLSAASLRDDLDWGTADTPTKFLDTIESTTSRAIGYTGYCNAGDLVSLTGVTGTTMTVMKIMVFASSSNVGLPPA